MLIFHHSLESKITPLDLVVMEENWNITISVFPGFNSRLLFVAKVPSDIKAPLMMSLSTDRN